MKDDFQIQFRSTPRPEFVAALYQRINKPMYTLSTPRGMRLASLTLSLFLLAATLLLAPSVRAFAQSLWRQIGGYTFTQGGPEPLDASQLPAPIRIVNTATSVSIEFTSDSLAAADVLSAGDQAGFPVLTPSYVPAGYVPMDGGWRITSENNSTAVTHGYFDMAKNFFFVVQWNVGEAGTKTFTREEIVDVQVHGQDGVWLPQASDTSTSTALVWEENGITYSIIASNGLPMEEMLMVAESLGR